MVSAAAWKWPGRRALLVCLLITFTRSERAAERPAPPPAATELREAIPTARQQPAEWRYTVAAPPQDWSRVAFDDADWRRGGGGFGTDGPPGVVVKPPWNPPDIWLRRTTPPPASPDPTTLKLVVFHDEDIEIFLDGVP